MVELKSSIPNRVQSRISAGHITAIHNSFKPPLISNFEPGPHLVFPDGRIRIWLTLYMSS